MVGPLGGNTFVRTVGGRGGGEVRRGEVLGRGEGVDDTQSQ